jgi:hypothetical protein
MKKTAGRRPAKARNKIVVAPLRQLTALTQPGEFDEVLALIEVARKPRVSGGQ